MSYIGTVFIWAKEHFMFSADDREEEAEKKSEEVPCILSSASQLSYLLYTSNNNINTVSCVVLCTDDFCVCVYLFSLGVSQRE